MTSRRALSRRATPLDPTADDDDARRLYVDSYMSRALRRYNLSSNPRAETDLTGYAAGGGMGAPTRDTTTPRPSDVGGAATVSWTCTTAGSTVSVLPEAYGIVPGQAYTFSAYVRVSTLRTMQIRVIFRDAAGTNLGSGFLSFGQAITTTFVRLSVSGTAPATGVRAYVDVVGSALAVNDTVKVTGGLYEPGPSAGTWFDGSLAAAVWGGTPHKSTSSVLVGLRPLGPYFGVHQGATGVVNTAAESLRSLITIPDPGWPYKITAEGSCEIRGLDNATRADFEVRVGSQTGPVVAVARGFAHAVFHAPVLTPWSGAANTVYTGSQTLYVVSFRRFGAVNYEVTDYLEQFAAYAVPA